MADPNLPRREALRLAGLLGAGGLASTLAAPPARAEFTYAPDIVLFCSPTLAAPLRHAGDLFQSQTGVPVHILAPPDRISAAQLERGERNDICILLAPVAAHLQQAGLADAQPSVGTWRNRLVIARLGAGPAPIDAARLLASDNAARLGIVDLSDDAVIDTAALLARLGVANARLEGSVDTRDVAFQLVHRAVDLGLIFATDANAGPFTIAATIPDTAYPPVRYAALLNRHVLSRNAAGFLTFLATPATRVPLTRSGLEIET
jgi:ABC-type molybdate transport system substrate-binding protein